MSIYDLQEQISSKFTNEVLLDILKKKSHLENIRIEEIKLGAASKKGDSYLSTVCRFTVKAIGQNKCKNTEQFMIPIIAKAIPKNIGRRKTFRSLDFFENEAIFYENVWISLNNFQQQKQIEKFNNIPLLLSSCIDGKHDYIAMEDLSYQGYGGAERESSLNYEHTVMILRLFARFHGLALAFKDQRKAEFEKVALSLKETYFSEKYRKWYGNFQKKLFNIIRDCVEKELPPHYLTKLNVLLADDLFGKVSELCTSHGPLSAITHGDAWIPNFLMQYGENKKIPKNIIMIDFQLTRYAPISNDLIFFLYSCANEKLLQNNWDDFILQYYIELSQTVESLGSNKHLVTLDELKDNIKYCMPFGLAMSFEALTMSLLDEEDVADLDAIQGDDAVPLESVWILHPFKTAEKRRRIAYAVKHAVDNNLI